MEDKKKTGKNCRENVLVLLTKMYMLGILNSCDLSRYPQLEEDFYMALRAWLYAIAPHKSVVTVLERKDVLYARDDLIQDCLLKVHDNLRLILSQSGPLHALNYTAVVFERLLQDKLRETKRRLQFTSIYIENLEIEEIGNLLDSMSNPEDVVFAHETVRERLKAGRTRERKKEILVNGYTLKSIVNKTKPEEALVLLASVDGKKPRFLAVELEKEGLDTTAIRIAESISARLGCLANMIADFLKQASLSSLRLDREADAGERAAQLSRLKHRALCKLGLEW